MDSTMDRVGSFINKLPRNRGTLSPVILARLAVSAILLAIAAFVEMKPVFQTLLAVLSALISGYDLLLDLLDCVMEKNFFSAPVILILVTFVSFFIGYPLEGPALLIVYQLGFSLVGYAAERSKQSALQLLNRKDADFADRASIVIENDAAARNTFTKEIEKASDLILKVLAAAAILFAIVMPLLTSLSVRESVHRALMLLTIALPLLALASFPVAEIIGLGFATRFGTLFNSTAGMEKLRSVNTAVLDKSGIFADNHPELIGVKTDVIDEKTFMEFVAHAVYYSDQAFAKAILAAEDREYRLDLISDFRDIPGSGVDVKIGGTNVTLAKRELLAERGEAVPYETAAEGSSVYYLMVSGKYIGKVLLSDNINRKNAHLISDLKAAGIRKCVLLTEDSREESESLGLSLDADEVFSEFTDETKFRYLESISGADTLYLYANSLQAHSNAALDIRASKKGKFADALIDPERLELFPEVIRISRRVKEICSENILFVFIIKAILVFLALTGYCTVWFAAFLDMAAAIAAILNAIRVTKEPLIQTQKQ